MDEIKAKLVALIAAVQEYDFGPANNGEQRTHLSVENGRRSITFGYGYFNGDKVLFEEMEEDGSNAKVIEEMTPEAGVKRLLEGKP